MNDILNYAGIIETFPEYNLADKRNLKQILAL